MKYVYVLTSTPNDFYYEQCLMSIFTLRHYMSNAQIYVLVDNKTASSLNKENKRDALKDLNVNIVVVDFEDSKSNIERSRILKTTLPTHISGDFLFIDCDTVICEDFTSVEKILENEDIKIASVLDGHVLLNEHKHKDYFLKREKRLNFTATKQTNRHFNSGVILYKDCPESLNFFKKWHELWAWNFKNKKDHHDQPSFNEASFRCDNILRELSGEWNCQLSQGGLYYLKEAKILHYFSSEGGKNYVPYYKLADKNLAKSIKEVGNLTDEIKQMLLEPKFQFNKVQIINDKRLISVMQSPLLFTLADIKAHLPFLFYTIENSCAFFRFFAKKIKRK